MTRIIAFASVGSLSPALPVGTLLLPDDYYSPNTLCTFFNDNALGHKVLTVHDGLRQQIIKVLKTAGVSPLVEHGVYAQTLGPRFESIAEIKALARDCHVVGMTCAHEMVLAAEIDLPYACISMIDNFANGISKPLLPEEWRAGVHNNLKKMETILGYAVLHPRSQPIASHPHPTRIRLPLVPSHRWFVVCGSIKADFEILRQFQWNGRIECCRHD